jgi:hypothetical protein
MAASTSREPRAEEKAVPSLYEQQLAQTPPPPTPTQAELDAMALGTYVPAGTTAAAARRSGEAQDADKR